MKPNDLVLERKYLGYLADLNEQAQKRPQVTIEQMKVAESVIDELKAENQMAWVGVMNSIRNRAEEIILQEMIYGEVVVCVRQKIYGIAILILQIMDFLRIKSIKDYISSPAMQKKLKVTMNGEAEENVFQIYERTAGDLSLEECLLFNNSFSLGARMILEVMNDN